MQLQAGSDKSFLDANRLTNVAIASIRSNPEALFSEGGPNQTRTWDADS
jgi:hypothetical protein